jgi:hypothetical protein
MRLGIFQILEQASQLKTTAEKVEFLQKHSNGSLQMILKYTFDPVIVWDLPDGEPPYKPCIYPAQELRLMAETRRLYLFLKGGNPNITKLRREALYIELLESVHPEDAKMLIAAKSKKLPYKGINAKLVKEAFPGLLTELEQEE